MRRQCDVTMTEEPTHSVPTARRTPQQLRFSKVYDAYDGTHGLIVFCCFPPSDNHSNSFQVADGQPFPNLVREGLPTIRECNKSPCHDAPVYQHTRTATLSVESEKHTQGSVRNSVTMPTSSIRFRWCNIFHTLGIFSWAHKPRKEIVCRRPIQFGRGR